jgi:hypothetical protein
MSDPVQLGESRDYLARVLSWPHFSAMGDAGGDRVPATKIESWKDIAKIIEQPFFKRQKTQLVFRGSRRFDWSLTPSLGRLDSRGIVTQQVAEAQLKLFRHAIRGRISDHALVEIDEENTKELWSVGQHHGLHTPLLDWTYSIYVALFFAFEKSDSSKDNPYRAIYVLNKSYVEHDGHCPDVTIVEPRKDDHGRLVNQAGLFTMSAYGDTLENVLINSLQDEVLGEVDEDKEDEELARYLCKIYIPNQDREECLRHLRMMNVHHASLFPDLIGAASYCNSLVAEFPVDEVPQAKVSSDELVAAAESNAPPAYTAPEEVAHSPDAISQVVFTHLAKNGLNAGIGALLVEKLTAVITKNQLPDWHKRENIQAGIRNAIRAVLRGSEYPVDLRDALVDALIEALPRPPSLIDEDPS